MRFGRGVRPSQPHAARAGSFCTCYREQWCVQGTCPLGTGGAAGRSVGGLGKTNAAFFICM